VQQSCTPYETILLTSAFGGWAGHPVAGGTQNYHKFGIILGGISKQTAFFHRLSIILCQDGLGNSAQGNKIRKKTGCCGGIVPLNAGENLTFLPEKE
jgi:hypothetical protein